MKKARGNHSFFGYIRIVAKRSKIIIIALLGIVLLGFMYLWYTDFWKIDTCLDLGGVWDYAKEECRYK